MFYGGTTFADRGWKDCPLFSKEITNILLYGHGIIAFYCSILYLATGMGIG